MSHFTVFSPRHILEEPAVPAVRLEAKGEQDVADALQRAGVPDPEAQAQAPQPEASPRHRLLPLQGRGGSRVHGHTRDLQLLSFLPVSYTPSAHGTGYKYWLCPLGVCDLEQVIPLNGTSASSSVKWGQ